MQEPIYTNCSGVQTGSCSICGNLFVACVFTLFVFYFYGVLVVFATTGVYIFTHSFYSGDLRTITLDGESLYFWEGYYVLPCYVDALIVYAGNGFLHITNKDTDGSIAAVFRDNLRGYSIAIG